MNKYFGTPLYQWVILAIGIIVSNIITDQFVLPWWAKLLVFGAVFFATIFICSFIYVKVLKGKTSDNE